MFGRNRDDKEYHISYTTRNGFSESMDIDKKELRKLCEHELTDAVQRRGRDGRTYFDYGFKINNITSYYTSGRDPEFFAPGISKVSKYKPGRPGYFIKDTRSSFKALAPGTDAILVFDTRDEAAEYFKEHQSDIEMDYTAQRDSFDFNSLIYESIVHSQDHVKGSLDLSGQKDVFPKNDIYTQEDVFNLMRMVGSYEDFHARNEYAQNLKFIRPTFAKFVNANQRDMGNGMIYLDLDSFDPSFKTTFDHFVKTYPEMVNQDVVRAANHEQKVLKAQAKLEASENSFFSAASEKDLMSKGEAQEMADDIVF